ncbi:MAG: tRNA preQ1(34) S-adenosylmethionine ribosyltransferase-isomerase QueA [candidate division Zixibacteria bacterium]|nr:tRNA preQ1(34) S-adenosylmethionine ribosyltransferase-isomerase QueA [candidate division Zixibacteria bacterium]
MNISLFDYKLPQELIAQFPSRRRDRSRLMVLDRSGRPPGLQAICPFRRIVDYLSPGDALVVNNTKVFKARLFGHRATGAKVEIFLVRPVDRLQSRRWYALVYPSRRVKEGERILFDSSRVLLARDAGGGTWEVEFESDRQRRTIISRFGHVPLPHYIKRKDEPCDIRRYQTVFAHPNNIGAVAAPTAGFHFTRSILDSIKARGIELVELCLHVGPGTFKPVTVDNVDDHVVDPEMASLPPEAATMLNRVRERGGKIVAVGTTSVRTLESAPMQNGMIRPFSAMVDLYIRPGHKFRLVDRLLTNFHLPKSSLLILVSAFAGREPVMQAYQEAISQKLRFYSYGDAMLIL